MIKNVAANVGGIRDSDSIPRWRSPEGNHSNILAWRIPWTEESSGLMPIGLQRVRHD